MRTIAHVDLDAFYVSVELLRRPELRGLPVVVAGSGPRAVVTTASYEAREFGVGSATPASRARRLCPDAVFIPPDFATYREVSARMMALVRTHVEHVEVVGLDEAYLDLSGLYSPRTAMRKLVAEIRGATQLTCSVGIGPNKLVAKVASDAEKPAGFVVLTREQACERFGGSPPGLVPGIGPKTAARVASRALFTPLTTASVEALPFLITLSRTARWPSSRTMFCCTSDPSRTCATSFKRTVAPLMNLTGIMLRSSIDAGVALVRIVY